jgi:hypothetical protein
LAVLYLKSSILRAVAIFFLALLMSGSVIKLCHVFSAEHHQAHDHPVCSLGLQSSESQTHLHTADFLSDSCDLCVYTFSTLDITEGWYWSLCTRIIPSVELHLPSDTILVDMALAGIYLRGPPVEGYCS